MPFLIWWKSICVQLSVVIFVVFLCPVFEGGGAEGRLLSSTTTVSLWTSIGGVPRCTGSSADGSVSQGRCNLPGTHLPTPWRVCPRCCPSPLPSRPSPCIWGHPPGIRVVRLRGAQDPGKWLGLHTRIIFRHADPVPDPGLLRFGNLQPALGQARAEGA